MGACGVGLYSGDYAMDLRSTVSAIARLPFEPAELLAILRQSESGAADDPTDSDHTVFWLVVADQFHKRGLECPEARERALAIVAGDEDLAAMARLGMDENSLAKRRATLEALAAAVKAPLLDKPRKVLKAPQPFVLEVGEAVAYPVNERGEPINPDLVGKPWPIAKSWKQAGWGAVVILERGRVFDYLAWYQPLILAQSSAEKPSAADLWAPRPWLRRNVGTLTARHARQMEFATFGRVTIDRDRLLAAFHEFAKPRSAAVNDISIANSIAVRELDSAWVRAIERGLRPPHQIESLAVVADPI
jgi:hypothetical protein